jgi:hypothetical protein
MRWFVIAGALVLTSCGPSTQSSDDAPDPAERVLPYGVVIGVGENWSLSADPGVQAISFALDDGAEPVEATATWTPPQTTDSGYRLASDELTIDLEDVACTQDDIPFPMRATVTYGGDVHTGCAAMRWDYQLIALMPQIDACIRDARGARWITFAGQQNDATFVRLQRNEISFDCRVSSYRGATVIDLRPRDESVTAATEGAAIFVRAPGENPGGECYEAPEVRGVNNELLGWMLDPMGC